MFFNLKSDAEIKVESSTDIFLVSFHFFKMYWLVLFKNHNPPKSGVISEDDIKTGRDNAIKGKWGKSYYPIEKVMKSKSLAYLEGVKIKTDGSIISPDEYDASDHAEQLRVEKCDSILAAENERNSINDNLRNTTSIFNRMKNDFRIETAPNEDPLVALNLTETQGTDDESDSQKKPVKIGEGSTFCFEEKSKPCPQVTDDESDSQKYSIKIGKERSAKSFLSVEMTDDECERQYGKPRKDDGSRNQLAFLKSVFANVVDYYEHQISNESSETAAIIKSTEVVKQQEVRAIGKNEDLVEIGKGSDVWLPVCTVEAIFSDGKWKTDDAIRKLYKAILGNKLEYMSISGKGEGVKEKIPRSVYDGIKTYVNSRAKKYDKMNSQLYSNIVSKMVDYYKRQCKIKKRKASEKEQDKENKKRRADSSKSSDED